MKSEKWVKKGEKRKRKQKNLKKPKGDHADSLQLVFPLYQGDTYQPTNQPTNQQVVTFERQTFIQNQL